jgi:hypothetical protein
MVQRVANQGAVNYRRGQPAMWRFLSSVNGFILGGVLGGGCGVLFQSTVGRSQWIRSKGIIYDLIATFAVAAPLVGLGMGALAGALPIFRWTGDRQASTPARRQPSDFV